MRASILRSSHRRCSVKTGVLKNFSNVYRKTPALERLFNKVKDPEGNISRIPVNRKYEGHKNEHNNGSQYQKRIQNSGKLLR